ncbi:iron ABC transporter permease [Rhodococcus sp. ABRD24]|uniref:ABC transporter permease n=1 Tax=Rhodococcus sp. ABRD24 TaxID=2507582 RepID=UPI001A955D0A|nr:iron ABC transporter permease [Rhodococcus sp. ABRD24]
MTEMTEMTGTTATARPGGLSRRVKRLLVAATVAAFGWFVITFLFFPNLSVIDAVLRSGHGSVGQVASRLMESGRVVGAIRDTLVIAVISTVTANVVGIAQVFFLEAFAIRGKGLLTVAYAVPLVFGSIAAVTGYAMVYGENGLITRTLQTVIPSIPDDWFSGMGAVIFVHTFTMTGYHFLFLRPAIRRVDFSMVEAARSLGMKPLPALFRVVLPVLKPTILASVLMAFISTLTSFAAPTILGGPELTMIAPMIQALAGLGRMDMAALLGLLLGAATTVLLVWALRQERRSSAMMTSKTPRPFEPMRLRGRGAKFLAYACAYLLAIVNLAPLVVTALLSLAPVEAIRRGELSPELTVEHYVRMLTSTTAYEPLVNSLTLAAIAIPLALVIGTVAAHLSYRSRRRFVGDAIQLTMFLPYFLPGILVALGFLIAFGSGSALVGGQVLVGTYWILPLAYTVLLLPVVSRFVTATYAGLDPSLEDAARSLGASPSRRFLTVILPALTPVLLQVAALGFNDTLSEYTVSVMLYNINNKPLGVTLGTLAAEQDPNLVGLTTAYVVIITALSVVVVLFADRMALRASRRGVGRR